jgi:hypothetical protein
LYAEPYPSVRTIAAAFSHATSGWRGVRLAMDQMWFVIFPLAQLAAVLTLRAHARSAAWRMLVCVAVLYYVQLFPRADFWHLLPVAGPSLVVAVGLALHLTERAQRPHRTAGMLLGALLVLAGVRFLPTVGVLRAAMSEPPADLPSLARATVRWDLLTEPRVRAIPAVVNALGDAEAVVGFPALGVFGFLTGKPSPLRHDYFFPGVPGPAETARVLAQLATARTARVVVLRDDVSFFSKAFRSHPDVEATIVTAFPVVERVGPYEVRRALP